MEEVYVGIDRIETSKDSSGYWTGRTVVFWIESASHKTEVPIVLDSQTADDDLLSHARAKLHLFLQGALEKTKAWSPES